MRVKGKDKMEESQRVRVRGRGSEGRVGAKGQTVVLNYD